MFKKTKLRLFSMLGLLLTVVARMEMSTSSIWYLYEPEIPQKLKYRVK